jgi:uncharacterized protein HemX
MENTNTNTILDQNAQTVPEMPTSQPIPGSMPTESYNPEIPTTPENNPAAISTLSDIHPIPEFQGRSSKNKLFAIIIVVIGVIILGATGFYYWKNMSTTKTEESLPVESAQVENNPAENTTEVESTNSLDSDPVITETDRSINETDSENIEQTSDDLEDFDFENIDLELQQNPGL